LPNAITQTCSLSTGLRWDGQAYAPHIRKTASQVASFDANVLMFER